MFAFVLAYSTPHPQALYPEFKAHAAGVWLQIGVALLVLFPVMVLLNDLFDLMGSSVAWWGKRRL